MAYNDPYAGRYGGQQQYGGQGQQQQHYGQYNEPVEYNPYGGAPPHATYDNGGYDNYNNYGGRYTDEPQQFRQGSYADEPHQQYPQRQPSNRSYTNSAPPPIAPAKSIDETSRFEAGEFTPTPRGPKTASNLRQYRQDFQGNLWKKGGRGSCCFRFFCCFFFSAIFLIVAILLALVLWLRPPSITFGTVAPMTSTGSTIQASNDGIKIAMGVNITVQNPNYFAVNFNKITADILYPIDGQPDTDVGGGTASDISIASNKETNFTFPFAIDYKTSSDPSNKILLDIATRCGILGGAKSSLTVRYKIKLGIMFAFIPLSPTISNSFTFTCPLSASDLSGLLGGAGALIGAANGAGRTGA
ncbi:LEA-2 domain-containing protein [Mycena indigotica]|uniref:LEA-2 domain-containing protein n=1 Tax=Mycena indigotica TaxID=2126181 RepID=A0A8H6W0F6_9AGAR|nr:LEA-2 domain-containing protein [Mycena indigotica]KAF7294834.1 LEA-2 domain-containing protein [Mycena indigotica]